MLDVTQLRRTVT